MLGGFLTWLRGFVYSFRQNIVLFLVTKCTTNCKLYGCDYDVELSSTEDNHRRVRIILRWETQL